MLNGRKSLVTVTGLDGDQRSSGEDLTAALKDAGNGGGVAVGENKDAASAVGEKRSEGRSGVVSEDKSL